MPTVTDKYLREHGKSGELIFLICPLPLDKFVDCISHITGLPPQQSYDGWFGTDGRQVWIAVPYDWPDLVEIESEVRFVSDGPHLVTIQWGTMLPKTYEIRVDLKITRMELYLEL